MKNKQLSIAIIAVVMIVLACAISFAACPGEPGCTDQGGNAQFDQNNPSTWSGDNINQVSVDQLAQNPDKAIQYWQNIEPAKKDELFSKNFEAFKTKADDYFSQQTGKPMQGLGTVTGVKYEGGLLKNGGATLDPKAMPSDVVSVEAIEGGFRYAFGKQNHVEVHDGAMDKDGKLSDGSQVSFSGENRQAKIEAGKVTLGEGASLNVQGKQITSGSKDFVITSQDGTYSCQGKGTAKLDIGDGTVMNVNIADKFSFDNKGYITGEGADAEISRNGNVEKTISGKFEYLGAAVTIEDYGGKHSTYHDALLDLSATSAAAAGKIGITGTGKALPAQFGKTEGVLQYSPDSIIFQGKGDVSKNDLSISSRSDHTLFEMSKGAYSVRGKMTVEDPDIRYEGRVDSALFEKKSDGTYKIDSAEDKPLADGGICQITKKANIADVTALGGLIKGQAGITTVISREDGKLSVNMDLSSQQQLAEIAKAKTQFAVIDSPFILQVGENDGTYKVNKDLGAVFTSSDGRTSGFESPRIIQMNLGTDSQTLKGIVGDLAGKDKNQLWIQEAGIAKIYDLQKKELQATGDAQAGQKSFDDTKAFIKSAYSDSVIGNAELASFIVKNIRDTGADLKSDYVKSNLAEAQTAISSDPAMQSFFAGENKGNLAQLTISLGKQMQNNPDGVQDYKDSSERLLQSKIALAKLSAVNDPSTKYDSDSVIQSYKALMSLEDTQFSSTDQGIKSNTQSSTFSTQKLNLGILLTKEYADKGDTANARTVIKESKFDLNEFYAKLPDDKKNDPDIASAVSGIRSMLDDQENAVTNGAFNRVQADLYTQSGEIQKIFQSTQGYSERVSQNWNSESGIQKIGSVVFTGGFGKDVMNSVDAFGDVKQAASNLRADNQVFSRGVYGLQSVYNIYDNPDTIQKWVDGKLSSKEQDDFINAMMVKDKEPLSDFEINPEYKGIAFKKNGKFDTPLGNLVYVDGNAYAINPDDKAKVAGFLEEVRPDARLTYYSEQYGSDMRKLIGAEQIAYTPGQYKADAPLEIDKGLQKEVFDSRIASLQMSGAGKVASYVDDMISPGSIAIAAATGGYGGAIASSATGLTGAGIALGESVAIDAATGTVFVSAGARPEDHPLLAMGVSMGVGTLANAGSSISRGLAMAAESQAVEAGAAGAGQIGSVGAQATRGGITAVSEAGAAGSLGVRQTLGAEFEVLGSKGEVLSSIPESRIQALETSATQKTILAEAQTLSHEGSLIENLPEYGGYAQSGNLALNPETATLSEKLAAGAQVVLGEQIGTESESVYGKVYRVQGINVNGQFEPLDGLVAKIPNDIVKYSPVTVLEHATAENLRNAPVDGVVSTYGLFSSVEGMGNVQGYLMEELPGKSLKGVSADWLDGTAVVEPGTQERMQQILENAGQRGLEAIDPHAANWMLEQTGTTVKNINGQDIEFAVYGNPKLIDLGGLQDPSQYAAMYSRTGIPDEVMKSYESSALSKIRSQVYADAKSSTGVDFSKEGGVALYRDPADNKIYISKQVNGQTQPLYDTGYTMEISGDPTISRRIALTTPPDPKTNLPSTTYTTVNTDLAGQTQVQMNAVLQGAGAKIQNVMGAASSMVEPVRMRPTP